MTDDKQPEVAEKKKAGNSIYKTIRFYVVMLAVLVSNKQYVADVYSIPSGSMEQTLHGREGSGDRIFCSKFSYWFDNPQRWDVFVFKFPYMQTIEGEKSRYKGENFIKRCVGLPGDFIAMMRGDIYVQNKDNPEPRRITKPDSVQRRIWLPVYAEDFHDITTREFQYYWRNSNFEIKNSELVATTNNSTLTFLPQTRFGIINGVPDRYVRRQYVEFTCPDKECGGKTRITITDPKIVARCPRCGTYLTEKDVTYYDYRCGYPGRFEPALNALATLNDPDLRRDDWHLVPDLRVQAKVYLPDNGSYFKAQIFDDLHLCALNFSASSDGAVISLDGDKSGEDRISISTGWHDLEFYRLDGVVRVYIDNVFFAERPVDDGKYTYHPRPTVSNIDLQASSGVKVKDIKISRDIYYYHQDDVSRFPNGFYEVPVNCYMALGDNCPSSNDSRNWGTVPQKNLVGKAQLVWWPLDSVRLIK